MEDEQIKALQETVDSLQDRVIELTDMVTRLLPPDHVGRVTYVDGDSSDGRDQHVHVAGYNALLFLSGSIGPEPKVGDEVAIWRTYTSTKFRVTQIRQE